MATILDALIEVKAKMTASVPISAWRKDLHEAITLLENGKSLKDDINSPIVMEAKINSGQKSKTKSKRSSHDLNK